MEQHIRESNLIENIDSRKEDKQSMKAWRYLQGLVGINEYTLLRLHNIITENQLSDKESGTYRKVNVTVGGSVCPSPFLAKQQIRNWLLDMAEPEEWTPKTMHVRFEKIHPFIDGNGRTGRMLMWWHELKVSQKPTLIKASERQEYYKWFQS